MKAPLSRPDREKVLVREFFGGKTGYFVDVGANDPFHGSQTWHLESLGWSGVLIEPQPDLAARLREARKAKVFAAACSSPDNAGTTMTLHLAGPMSSLDRERMSYGAVPEASIAVPVRTLDDILTEAGAPLPLDFLSLDVEGHEQEVLAGFDIARWRPRLILMEDQVTDHSKHRIMRRAGYRLVRYTDYDGWYVPAESRVWFGWREWWTVVRKYYLALPFRKFRDATRRLRGVGQER